MPAWRCRKVGCHRILITAFETSSIAVMNVSVGVLRTMKTMSPMRRRGMSLIEVVVVIAIVSVLIGLSIPAVQYVRAIASMRKCQNHLRQLILSAQNYDSTHGSLPPGYLGNLPLESSPPDPSFREAQWIGVLPFLLPQLGYDSIHRSIRVEWSIAAATRQWYTIEDNVRAAQHSIDVLVCPVDDPYSNVGPTIRSLGFFPIPPDLAGLELGLVDDARIPPVLGRTNYVGVSGKAGRVLLPSVDRYEGVFSNRSNVSLQHVAASDGTSNVLAFGETLGGSYPGFRDHAFSWMGVGVTAGGWGIFDVGDFRSFSSKHSGMTNFAFCDGSVKSLRKNMPIEVFIRLAAFHDGGVVNQDDG